MSTPILATKLYIPPPRANAVRRLRLLNRLNDGLKQRRKLTLISAPAGFGKTTLISEWLTSCDRQTAWMSLDESDNDPNRFLIYLIAALQSLTFASGIGGEVLKVLQSSQPPAPETVLTALLNEITALSDSFQLVLDDYHLIDAKSVVETLAFLLERLPPQMHIVITTREDPALPLPRLRARGQLTELRANDLRFTSSEAAEFLNQVMGLNLSEEQVTTLEARTEGWIAGLQLAALSMQNQQDVAGFIQTFAGDHRYILDYLVEEVLQSQSEDVRRFLLQTSILDRLSSSLCEAITGEQQSQSRLETLERGNFFVVPLDDKRQWYRYHHLFAEVLQVHLKTEQPDHIAILHQRASEWYESNGLRSEAIRHALSARDFERAATLIELFVPETRRTRQETTLLGWLKMLPDDLLRQSPVLSIQYAGTLLQTGGKLEDVEVRLGDAEGWLEPSTGVVASTQLGESSASAQGKKMLVADEAEFRRLPASIAIYRAGIALAKGDIVNAIKNTQRVLNLSPDDDHLGRGAATALMGLACWTNGELDSARQLYVDGMSLLQKAGFVSDTIGVAIMLADVQIAQGSLREALTTYERGLQLANQPGGQILRGAADMHVGISEIYREYNDLETAAQHLHKSQQLGELAGLPKNPYRWCVAMALLREAQGDVDGALELLYRAEQLYRADFSPNVRPIGALMARVWLAQGKLNDALNWARKQGLSTQDKLSYLREFEHITLARVLLERYRNERSEQLAAEITEFLNNLAQAAHEADRSSSLIEILLLQALTCQLQSDNSAAFVPFKRALILAEPEGYIRIFAAEGLTLVPLLEKAARQGVTPNYVRRLLSALGKSKDNSRSKQALIEPLSERENQVLRLLGSELSGAEIARELMVSLNTINTHTKNIYAKLGVNNRRAAVHRAAELHLL